MEQKRTPGPWRYDPKSGEVYYDDSNGGEVFPRVATVDLDNVPKEQGEADGELLAAAPELLAALEAMWAFASRMVEKHGMDGDDTMTGEEHAAWQEAAGDTSCALRKAVGG